MRKDPLQPLDWQQTAEAARRLGSHLREVVLPDHRLTIMQVFHYRMKRGWRISAHEHSYCEMSLILSGEARDDSNQSHRRSQKLTPGSVFIHPANVSHAWSSPWGVCHRLVVCFNVDPQVQWDKPDRWPCWQWLLDHAWAMLHLAHEAKPGWQDRASARLSLILAEVLTLSHDAPQPFHTSGEQTDLADRVDEFLEDHYSQSSLTLADIASHLGVSVRTLTQNYQARRGVSIGQRMTTLRIEQAAHLLRETDQTLQHIAGQVGVNQAAYLCRLFRQHLRTTPGQYRKKYLSRLKG